MIILVSLLRQSPAEQLPVDAGQVDLLTSMTAAHWFDRQKFLLEADRVLRPGGCLALLSYTMDMELEHGDTTEALNDVCKEVPTMLTLNFPRRNIWNKDEFILSKANSFGGTLKRIIVWIFLWEIIFFF